MKVKVVTYEAEEGGYWAKVPSLPGVYTQQNVRRRSSQLRTGVLVACLLVAAACSTLTGTACTASAFAAPHPARTQRALSPASEAPRWVNISPPQVSTDFNKPANNYGFQDLAIDPSKPSILYVGTCYQGLWKSIDGGATWFKVNTGTNGSALDSGRLWSVVIDPMSPQTIYTVPGYGVGGIWKSTDGGVDWTALIPSTSPTAQQLGGVPTPTNVAIDPANHLHLIASSHFYWGSNYSSYKGVGVLESNDGGNTWTIHTPIQNSGDEQQVAFLSNSSTWLLSSPTWQHGNNGIFLTTNSGQTWTRVYGGAADGKTQPVFHNGTYYLATAGAVLRSTDTGASWQPVLYGNYNVVLNDGNELITGADYPSATSEFFYSPLSDGVNWYPYIPQVTCISSTCRGPFAMEFDPLHRIIYSSNSGAGVWKLHVGVAPYGPKVSISQVMLSPTTAKPDGKVKLTAHITTTADLKGVEIRVLGYAALGHGQYRQVFAYVTSGVNLSAGKTVTYTGVLTLPRTLQPGTIIVKIGIFHAHQTTAYAVYAKGVTLTVKE